MRISDWSSDVCSSDLTVVRGDVDEVEIDAGPGDAAGEVSEHTGLVVDVDDDHVVLMADRQIGQRQGIDRKSVVQGKSVSVRVALGGRRILKKKQQKRE